MGVQGFVLGHFQIAVGKEKRGQKKIQCTCTVASLENICPTIAKNVRLLCAVWEFEKLMFNLTNKR